MMFTMATARELYDAMIRERIAPTLREHGFRKQRNRFARAEAGGWQVIDFQASQFGSRDKVHFTINVGTAYPELRRDDEAWTDEHSPPEYDLHVRERIAWLMGEDRDKWWAVDCVT